MVESLKRVPATASGEIRVETRSLHRKIVARLARRTNFKRATSWAWRRRDRSIDRAGVYRGFFFPENRVPLPYPRLTK